MENQNFNLYSRIFVENDKAVEFLLEESVIEEEVACSSCSERMLIRK